MEPITQLSQLDFSKTYTYADYLTWKFDKFVELIKGKVMQPMAGPSRRHQQLSNRLEFLIASFLRSGSCEMYHAPFDVRLTTGGANGDQQITTVVQPDICVVCDPAKLDDRGCLGAPDWIIEIVSPGNTARDTKTKFDLYEESGVREYWIVYPGQNTITAYVLESECYQLAGEYIEPGLMPVATLPGLALEWAEIFTED
ncbi:Uma2 family endonuclease [Hymenobacter sp. UV11]|uniref:Uma2 family endonuclease n=1 Tax=Hymenobacter sp. UV11 TaxID=1849735 RepID=UPI00105D268A|nr:Uma2 family endonuclease [Hymenobacter sp. UV11]TDN36641.1 restriction endonuclease [Hymenobacter sp. UV11]TFZ66145.1 Uma2 family endonuclease [Hymenobacter sp. UV11]